MPFLYLIIISVLNFLHHGRTVLEAHLIRSSHFRGGSIAHAVRYPVKNIDLLLAQRIFKGYAERVELIRELGGVYLALSVIIHRICAEHGISVIEPIGKGVSHYENEMKKEGKSWKDKLRNMLREIISYSRSFEDFLKNCTDSGIEYVYTPQNKVKLKFKLSDEGQQRFTRADTLGDEFEPEAIAETIETAQKKAAAEETMEKFLAARRAKRQAQFDMLNATAAKPTEPKPEPSAPTPQPTPICIIRRF